MPLEAMHCLESTNSGTRIIESTNATSGYRIKCTHIQTCCTRACAMYATETYVPSRVITNYYLVIPLIASAINRLPFIGIE